MTQWIITSSLLILAVLLIRIVGRDRLSARLRYALWALVLLRLLMPFSVGESALSVQNLFEKSVSAEVRTEPILIDENVETTQTTEMIEMPEISESDEETNRTSINTPALVWGIGTIITGAVFIISNLRFAAQLHRSRKEVMHRFVPVYVTDAVETPCLFGFPCPAVYLTPDVVEDKTMQRHVLAHELTHYRHGDHLWSLLRCVAVTIHWYNPLVWAAAVLSQKDGELACDEGALGRLGGEERTSYARTLLGMTCVGYKGMLTAATSMTGSESDLKTRIKRIAANPKMTAAAGIVTAAALLLAGCAVFTDAKAPAIEGVWVQEMDAFGEEIPQGTTARHEYEFSDGVGRQIFYIGDDLRTSEQFAYTLNNDTVTIYFAESGDVQEFAWSVKGDTLTLGRGQRETTLTAVERKSVPYLPDGFIEPLHVVKGGTGQSVDLSDRQTVQLLDLLRSGTIIARRTEQDFPVGGFNYALIGSGVGLNIVDGIVCKLDADKVEIYELSNAEEIKAFFYGLEWNVEGEVIGTMTDIGDVVRIRESDGMMEPTVLSDEIREYMISLIAEGLGDAIGEEEVTCEDVSYTIISSGLDAADDFVTLSDNGSLYMDGVRYELHNANALLQLLDAQYAIQITHDGYDIENEVNGVENDWYGTVGEDIYFELQGVLDGGEVTWSSTDESVCTVAGDANGATVTFTGVGEARITAEWQSKWNTKGYTIGVRCGVS